MVVVAVLASSLPGARADDLDQPDGHDPLDQQNEPDQRSIDEDPFEQEYPLVDWGTLIDFRFAATDDALSTPFRNYGDVFSGGQPVLAALEPHEECRQVASCQGPSERFG